MAGVLLGILIARVVRAAVPSLPTAMPVWSVLLELLVSSAVGLFFGLYPAVKASRLDRAEALRHE